MKLGVGIARPLAYLRLSGHKLGLGAASGSGLALGGGGSGRPIRSGEKRRDDDVGTAVVNGRWLGNNETRGQVPRREKKAKKLKMCQKGKVQSS